MTSATADTPVTYIGKEGSVKISADHNSQRLRFAVEGREVEVSVPEAVRLVEKLRRGIVWAQ